VASKVSSVVTGGDSRAASVQAALAEVPREALVVLVHDAARPLVGDDVIERVLASLGEGYDGAVPGLPVPDTLKRVDRGVVAETVERTDVVAVQTPQAFTAAALRTAFAGELGAATDCASLVEQTGGRVRVVDGDPRLLKVTTPDDLELVERLLATD
jgi:2-C-methyl-D-erythritol 4-phosphate cytidylyltransferase